MIILKTQLVESIEGFQAPLTVIEAADDGYRVTRLNMGAGPDLVVRASDMEPWGRRIYYWSAYGDGFIVAQDYEESRDYDAFMRSRFGCPEGPVLVAARGGSDELVLVAASPVHTALPYEHHYGFGPSISAVEQAIPGYANSQRAKANKAKRDLLERISPIALLAEQEKQIDLLSMLVIDLAEKQPANERPAWLADFKAMLEQQSAVQFKGVSGALTDVGERKAKMRELQRAYFRQRGD